MQHIVVQACQMNLRCHNPNISQVIQFDKITSSTILALIFVLALVWLFINGICFFFFYHIALSFT